MSKSFDRVIDAFADAGLRVKPLGNGKASLQAPGHSAADLSVSVTAIGGRTLLWSHSDPVEDVMAAVGLTMGDLFDDPKGVEYTYPDGRKVSRSPAKRFFQSGNTKGSQLYRADKLAAARVVYFVEGEQDVHALESVGVTATCTAMGAGKAHKFDLTPLHGKRVMIVRDMDEPGLDHAVQVAGILEGKAETHLLEPVVGKDAADHIASGHTLAEFREVPFPVNPEPVDVEFEAAVEQQRQYLRVQRTAKERDAAEDAAKVAEHLDPKTLGQILDLTFEEQWVIPGLLERGDRMVVTGLEGGGKSYFLRQLSVMSAAGVHPFTKVRIEPTKVLVVDAENSERQWARAGKYVAGFAEQIGVRSPRDNVIVSAGRRIDLNRSDQVNEIHRLIDEHKPDVLQIGPLYKLVGKEITTDTEAAPLIKALDSFRERGVVLLMEAHAGNDGKNNRTLRPRGSSALLGWPEFGFGLLPDEENPEMVDLVRWRGDREKREWPAGFRRGWEGELPWEPLTVWGK